MRLLLRHDHFCNCSDCSMQNGLAMDAMLQRDPKSLVASARLRVADDRFAYGLLLSAEMVLSGQLQYPPKMLPQSAVNWLDLDAFTRRYA